MPVKSVGIRLRGWWASYHRYILLKSLLNHLATGLNSFPSATAKALLAPIPALPLRCNGAAWAGLLARHRKAPSSNREKKESPTVQPHTPKAFSTYQLLHQVPQGTNSEAQNVFLGVLLGNAFRSFPSIGLKAEGDVE